jgi:murein DD-endopeptidase MepM/ murein hydrolase activator NlpD
MSKKETTYFEDKMKKKALKALKNSKYGWIFGGFSGRIIVFLLTLIIPIVASTLLFVAVIVVLSGGMAAILQLDPDLKVTPPSASEDGGEGNPNREVIIPEELKGKLLYPSGNVIMSFQGMRKLDGEAARYHNGMDISGRYYSSSKADPIYPVYPGKVFFKEKHASLGNYVVLEHNIEGTVIYSLYGHMSETHVRIGDVLNFNNSIGTMGTTGHSTGVHLHLELHNANFGKGGGRVISKKTALKVHDFLQCTESTKVPYMSGFPRKGIQNCMDYRTTKIKGG